MTADETAAGPGWPGVGFGLAIAVFAAFEQFKLPPVLPVMLDRFGYDRLVAGGLMSVYAVAGLALSLPVGRALANRGPARLLAPAFALFLLGQGLALLAPESGAVMLIARGLEGAGFTVCAIAGPLIAAAAADARRLPLVVGLTAAWIPAGQVGANLAAIPAVARGDWAALWWLGIALTLLLAGWSGLRRRAGLDGARIARPRPEHTGAPRTAPAAVAVAAAIFALWSGQYFGFMTWLPEYLVEVHGLGVGNAVLAYTLPSAVVGVLCVATGAALRAGAPFAPLFWGSIAIQTAIWLLVPAIESRLLGLAVLALYGLTAGVTPVCLFSLPWIMAGPDGRAGSRFGALMTGRNLGVLAGPVLLAAALSLAPDWAAVWPLFGALTGIAGLAAFGLGRYLRGIGAIGDAARKRRQGANAG